MNIAYYDFFWPLASACLKASAENACVSPYGVFQLLAVIAEGASGVTRLEFDRLLGQNDHVRTAQALHDLLQAFSALSDRTTVIAQKLLPAYTDMLRNVFGESLTLSPTDKKGIF